MEVFEVGCGTVEEGVDRGEDEEAVEQENPAYIEGGEAGLEV